MGLSSNRVLITNCKETICYQGCKNTACRFIFLRVAQFNYPLYTGHKLNVLSGDVQVLFWTCNAHSVYFQCSGGYNEVILFIKHYVKSVLIRSYFRSIFLYSDWIWRFTVNLRIQSEYRKIRTRNNSVFGHFSRCESSHDSSQYFRCIFGSKLLVSAFTHLFFQFRISHPEIFCRKGFLKRFWIIYRKTPPPCNFIKKATSSKLFSCERF